MSSMSHDTDTTPTHEEHGTTASYIIGFVLSVVFTLIPYYLVVEKVVTGNALVATIMGFAVLQMIIQIVFFLHIGREKGPRWQLGFFVSTVGIIFVVVGGSLWIMSHLYYNMTAVTPMDASKKLVEKEGIYQIDGQKTGACEGQHATHKIILKDDGISPSRIDAKQCDKLTFVNEDGDPRYIMFGSFDQPEQYAGEDMLTVTNRRAKTITLNEPGTHQFHDHMYPEATGSFTVEQ
jgi:cytochrome o ubiquinol oxidase operon protein cyoD